MGVLCLLRISLVLKLVQMNTINTFPWETMHPGQVIGNDVFLPPGEITVAILIGEGSNPCPRSETSDADTPRILRDVVLKLKKQCGDCNRNHYCSRLIGDTGTIIFEDWDEDKQTLSLRLVYNRK